MEKQNRFNNDDCYGVSNPRPNVFNFYVNFEGFVLMLLMRINLVALEGVPN